MATKQQSDGEYIEDRILWTLTSIIRSLNSLRTLLSFLPQTEGNKFKAILSQALEAIPAVSQPSEMSRATSDDQLKFLLSCVRHSNSGKVDFVEVALECGIVSKGAAAKRYERLLKANGIHPSGGLTETPARRSPTTPIKQKSKELHEKPSASKKRKHEHLADLPSSKTDSKKSSKPVATTTANTQVVAGLPGNPTTFNSHPSPYDHFPQFIPTAAPHPRLAPIQVPAHIYHSQVGMMPYQAFQGLRKMAPNQFTSPVPLLMPAMLSATRDQSGFSNGHSNGANHGLEEYLNGPMYYQESMPKDIQPDQPVINELGPPPLRLPPRPLSLVQGPKPDDGSVSPNTKGKDKEHTSSVLILD